MSLDRFYPIFDSADWISRMVPYGMKLVQLRVKDAEPDVVRAEIRRARDICVASGVTLVVNDYWEIAIDEGCDYLHLGQEDLDDADVPAIRRAGLGLGLSTHDRDELDRAMSFTPDYVALGPIYPTILKKMKWEQQGIDKLTEWRGVIGDTPLVAIGGMSIDRAAGAFAAGADCVAAVTDITLHKAPEVRLSEWVDATRAKP